jgi:restriction system protein
MIELWWLLLPLMALLGYSVRGYHVYRFQNRGEELVRKSIINQLPSSAWHLLNNVTLKVGDGTTQIDHILVSRYGVFVMETKHYTGWIFGDAKSKQWTQVIYGTKRRFQNPLHQNYKHLKAVQELLDFLSPEQVVGFVVFTGDAKFKTDIPSGVFSLDNVVQHFNALSKEVLTENRMQFCVGRLECNRLALTQETDIEHQINLAKRA